MRFFDAIYAFATSQSKNINISDLYANDEEVIKTFSDMFEKHKYLCDAPVDSISLDDMVHITSRYFSTLGISAPTSVCVTSEEQDLSFSNNDGKELLSFSLDNSEPLPYGYAQNAKKGNKNVIAQKGDLFILVHDSDPSFENLCKEIITISEGGILPVITEHTFGALMYANEDMASEISDLITCYKGQKLLIVSKENKSALCSILAEHNTTSHIIAIATDTPVYSIIAQNKVFNHPAQQLHHPASRGSVHSQPLQQGHLQPYTLRGTLQPSPNHRGGGSKYQHSGLRYFQPL